MDYVDVFNPSGVRLGDVDVFNRQGVSLGAFGDYEDWCGAAAANWPGKDRQLLRARCQTNPYPWVPPWTELGKRIRGLPLAWSTPQRSVAFEPRSVAYGDFGGDFEDWCDAAAAIWPGEDREVLRAKCKDNPFPWLPPWTDVGKGYRGLPGNWSTSPSKVAEGGTMAIVGDVLHTGQDILNTTQGQPNVAPPAKPPAVIPAQTNVSPMIGPSAYNNPTVQTVISKAASVAPVIAGLGALAIGALLLFRKKGGALGGYSSRRRKHRRVRRSRR